MYPYVENFWSLKSPEDGDVLMYYTKLEGAAADVVNAINNKRISEGNSSEFYKNTNDLYNGYMPAWAYWWGSNATKANVGNMNYDFINYDIDKNNHSRQLASGIQGS